MVAILNRLFLYVLSSTSNYSHEKRYRLLLCVLSLVFLLAVIIALCWPNDKAEIQFRTYSAFRRTEGFPEQTVSLESRAEESITDCTDECRNRQWCTAFNVNKQTGQCGMFREFLMSVPMSASLTAGSADDVAGVFDQPIPESMPSDGLRNGSRLSFTFRTLNDPTDNVHLYFNSGSDVVFSFGIRFAEKAVVRNSRINGVWGTEERSGGFPFSINNFFTTEVVNRGPHFELIVNGTTFTTFVHRMNSYTIDSIIIENNIARDPFECRLEYDY